MKTALVDLRGKGRWLPTDYTRKADLWIIGASWTEKPVAGTRTLAHLSASYLTLDGSVMGPPGSLNDVIGRTMKRLPVQTPLWTSADGRQQQWPIDLTDRHATSAMADVVTKKMAAHDGVNIDWFGFGWAYPELGEEFWKRFDYALASWVEQMRSLRPDWIFLGQMHQNTPPSGALNGRFLEDLTGFGMTVEKHRAQIEVAQTLAKMSGRESVFVVDLREPLRWPAEYREMVKAFCVEMGLHYSEGRDGAAVGSI